MNSISDAQTSAPDPHARPVNAAADFISTGGISTQHRGDASQADSELAVFPPGTRLSEHIELTADIGRGGMGIVYRAIDHRPRPPRTIAVKVLQHRLCDQAKALRRFLFEGESRKLKHPKLLEVYSVDRCPQHDVPFITMEYFAGWNLRQWQRGIAKSPRPFSLIDGLTILSEICDALAYVHRVLVHRDVKPENILARQLPTGLWDVKLADFGIAKPMESDGLTRVGAELGTSDYMAPEQRANASAVDLRADLYSLGVVVYELLTGQRPLGLFSMPSALCRHLSQKTTLLADEIIKKSLANLPAQRYGTAPEMQQDLRKLIAALEATPDRGQALRNSELADRPTPNSEVPAPGPRPVEPRDSGIETFAEHLAEAERALTAQTPDWPARVIKSVEDFLKHAQTDDWIGLRAVAPYVPEKELRDFAVRYLAVVKRREELTAARTQITLR